MRVFTALRWMFVTSLLIAGAAGGGAYWFYTRSDELLKAELLTQLAERFPGCLVDLERAHFDFSGSVRAHQVTVTLPDESQPALTVAELVIALNRDTLADAQAIEIHQVRLISPRVWAVRYDDASWNWEQLQIVSPDGSVLPDIEIEHGQVAVRLEAADPRSNVDIQVADLKLAATASSERSWSIAASGQVDDIGSIGLQADFSLDGSPWNLTATADGLLIDQRLIAKALTIRPEWRKYLDEAETRLETLASGALPSAESAGSDFRSRRSPSIGMQTLDGIPELGIQLLTDVTVHLENAPNGARPNFFVTAEIRNGRLMNPLLPLPLHEVTGSFSADPSQIVLKSLRGRHGESIIHCGGRWSPNEPPKWSVRGRKIVIDDTLSARLPAALERLVRSMQLTGICDFDAEFLRTDQGCVPKVDLRLSRASMLHEKCPYPVRDLEGTLKWRGDMAFLEAHGQAGTSPLTATGTIRHPGPGAEMTIIVQVNDVPIDSTLLDAASPVVKTTATALDLRGTADFWGRLTKPAGLGEKFTPHIFTRFKDCSLKYEKFPLRIDRITGFAKWDGETATFQNLRGRHADADVFAHASYKKSDPDPGQLHVELSATKAPFDAELLAALPERLQQIWREFNPIGRFDVESEVDWSPGGDVEIRLPSVKVQNSEVTLKDFPFPWYNVAGRFSYADDKLTVHSMSAEHDDCRLRGSGYASCAADRPWQFHCTEFFVDDLPTSPALRRALPPALRTVFDALNPTGTLSLQGPMTFYGPDERRENVGITWDTDIVFSGSDLTLGISVKNIHGRVSIQGAWDGENAAIRQGSLDVDSLEVYEHQLTQVRGPFSYQQEVLVAGSRQAVLGPLEPAAKEIHWEEQITARAIDGMLLLNGIVNFEHEPKYQLRMLLSGGNLEQYAQTYLKGQTSIRGNLNGWMDLRGIGTDPDNLTGSGRLVIRPAELYELPVFVQIFRVLGPLARDRSAFKEADFEFTVANSRFNFQKINLDGNGIRLFGRGYVRFDGVISFEFFSEMSRSQIPIPVISNIAKWMSRGWVGVTVAGRIGDPRVEMRAIPELDDALRQFLGAFDPTLMRGPNRLP